MSDFQTILTKLNDIEVSQVRTEEKQNATHNIVVKLETKVGQQNGRIGKLESWRSYLLGAFGFAGIIGTILWRVI